MLFLTMPNEGSIRPKWKASRRPQALTSKKVTGPEADA